MTKDQNVPLGTLIGTPELFGFTWVWDEELGDDVLVALEET